MPDERKVPAIKQPPVRRRASRKLLALLIVFFATVLIILFFQSTFSKISKIDIVGNELVSAEAIGQAAQVKVGDNFFLLPAGKMIARIEALGAIEAATVHRSFPGYVRIEVKEYPRVAFQIDGNGKAQAVLADGTLIAPAGRGIPVDKPLLTNWRPDDPIRAQLCQTLAGIPDPYMSDISEIVPEPSNAWGDGIRMYTRSHFEVVTRVALLTDKMPRLGDYIHSLQDQNNNSGVITMLETDRYKPFPADSIPQNPKEPDKSVKKN